MSSFERQLCCGGIMQTASHASSHFLIGLVPIMLNTLYHPTMSDFEWKWNPMNFTSYTLLRLLLPFFECFSHCSTAEGAEYRWHPCGLFGNSHPAGCSLPCVPCLISKSWRETRLRGVSVCLRVIWGHKAVRGKYFSQTPMQPPIPFQCHYHWREPVNVPRFPKSSDNLPLYPLKLKSGYLVIGLEGTG